MHDILFIFDTNSSSLTLPLCMCEKDVFVIPSATSFAISWVAHKYVNCAFIDHLSKFPHNCLNTFERGAS